MRKHFWAVAGFAVILTGCIPSLYPLYTEKDLIFDAALVGTWSEENAKESWSFEKDGATGYKLVMNDGDKKGEFNAHLVKLDGLKFLDLFPDDTGLKAAQRNDFYNLHYLPTHTFIKVLQVSPTLRMSVMDPKWLEGVLKEDPKALRHERMDDRVVLTAPTAELQAFLVKHANTEGAWGEPSKLTQRTK